MSVVIVRLCTDQSNYIFGVYESVKAAEKAVDKYLSLDNEPGTYFEFQSWVVSK